MADIPSAALVQALLPSNPEQYGIFENPVKPHARAFGAGLVDPSGLLSWAANKIAGTPSTDWYERFMQEKRNESPIAAGMGSAVPMAAGGVGYMAARNAAMGLSSMVPPGAALEAMGLLTPPAMMVGGAIGRLREEFLQKKQRPQAAYPPSGG